MRLLLDSSGSELVCALADAEGVIEEVRYPTGSEESKDIGAAVGPLLGELLPRDLDAIVVGTGPGSFIGTRIAISFANGLAATGEVALYGVDSLAAIGAVFGTGRCVVLRDARRGEVYCYGPIGTNPASRLISLEELRRDLVLGIEAVVVEEPSAAQAQAGAFLEHIHSAGSAAGTNIIHVSSVPAEGLRRLYPEEKPKPYVEPAYLRGFL